MMFGKYGWGWGRLGRPANIRILTKKLTMQQAEAGLFVYVLKDDERSSLELYYKRVLLKTLAARYFYASDGWTIF